MMEPATSPSLGQIVHYALLDTDNQPAMCWAAIVVRPKSDDIADLFVFNRGNVYPGEYQYDVPARPTPGQLGVWHPAEACPLASQGGAAPETVAPGM